MWDRLGGPARVTVVASPAGSGKTVLLRSWATGAELAGRVAWVSAGSADTDPRRFWVSVLDALRATPAGSAVVRAATAGPDLDGWALVERLLADVARLGERLHLVVDDVHELGADQALRQLELLVMRAPPQLRFVLASRHDVRLGLHRLRLEGELAELRADDLRFSPAEARRLFDAAGLQLPDRVLTTVYERTEGWAAGLRLAALSLDGDGDPGRFAVEFSGSDRTVAEYLLAEVLDRQGEDVRRLLVRTSVLERVNGELADLLTGSTGGERVLHELEEANAFVVSLDPSRSWFRYHHLFADLLRLQLRGTEPGEVTTLHELAAGWLADHGYPVEAIRHAQAAGDWERAARLLVDHWPVLYLDGQSVTVHTLLAGFPAGVRAADAGLAAIAAANELARGSVVAAERSLRLAERHPSTDGGPVRELVSVVRLLVAWHRGDLPALARHAERLDLVEATQGAELRALALVALADSEIWTGRLEEAELHLERTVTLARRIGRPYLEFLGLVYQAELELSRWFPLAAERAGEAIELAERHGWADETTAGLAYNTLGSALAWQGRPEEAAPWVQRAERTVDAEPAPVAAMGVQYSRGQVELGRGRPADALTAFRAAERLAAKLAAPHPLARPMLVWQLHTLARLGDTAAAEQMLSGLGERARDRGEMRTAVAAVRLAQGDPQAAVCALAPVLDGSARTGWGSWLVEAFLLEATARDALGDRAAAGRAVERALERAEAEGVLLWFLLDPAPGPIERHAARRTAHPALLARILDLRTAKVPAAARPPVEPLSGSEIRVLRYLPTHLSAPEIAAELSVSTTTVKTHLRNLYAKLGVHRRAEAVACARALHLLAPSAPRR